MMKLITLLLLSFTVIHADLKTDLTTVNERIMQLNIDISDTNLSADTMCSSFTTVNQEAQDIVNTISLIDQNISQPVTLDEQTLAVTEALFINVAILSTTVSDAAFDMTLLGSQTDAITLKEGITAMLQLSSEIGEMANRIGQMADKILIMSDNIGLMADRILEMQMIQNENIALTQNMILDTQTNILSLVSVIESASYEVSLDALVAEGNYLIAKLSLVTLNPWNMARELQEAKTDIHAYFQQIKAFQETLTSDTLQNTIYVNAQSLDALVNLSVIMASLGTVIDGYTIAVEASKIMTRESTLLDAMESMLALSADIGKMSNAILEMADQILLMADNIGMQADQIILTQQLQNTNILTAQTAILAAQQLALTIIASSI